MRSIRAVVTAGLIVAAFRSIASADVQLAIRDGRVSLVARNATVTEILAEWARVGQTKVVGLEKIPREPISIELKDVPEPQALDIVLRSSSGYMAALRASYDPNASRFDRLIVMPPSVVRQAPVATARVTATYAGTQPTYASAPASDVVVVGKSEAATETPSDTAEEPPPVLDIAGAVQPSDARTQAVMKQRHALETVDPREFKLPPGLLAPAGQMPRGGVVLPGMVVQPTRQPQ